MNAFVKIFLLCTILGSIFSSDGVGQNPDQRALFQLSYEKAAAGDSEAQFIVGGMYGTGIGVDKNESQAFDWIFRSATQGNIKALLMMSDIYKKGHLGIRPNLVAAYAWADIAANQKSGEGIAARFKLKYLLKPEQIAAAEKLSHEFKIVPETGR